MAVAESLESRTLLSAIAFRTLTVEPGSGLLPLAAGDFNGDGKTDMLAYTDIGAIQVRTLLGNGDGTFEPPMSAGFADGQIPIVADLNGDGKLDLVTAGINYFLGNGDGTFQPAVQLATPHALSEGAVADINSDGRPDLLTNTSSGIAIYYGDSAGSFPSTPQTLDVPGYQFCTADFDGDGRIDIAVSGSDNLYILHNNDDGTFTSLAQAPAFGLHNSEVSAADFNGDGKPDLAFSANGILWTSLNLGGNRFSAPREVQAGQQILPANFTNDGKADLITSDFENYVEYFTGTADGLEWQPMESVHVPMAVGDFNRDGLTDFATPDFAVQNPFATNVLVHLSDRVVGLQAAAPLHGQLQDATLAQFNDNLAINAPIGRPHGDNQLGRQHVVRRRDRLRWERRLSRGRQPHVREQRGSQICRHPRRLSWSDRSGQRHR